VDLLRKNVRVYLIRQHLGWILCGFLIAVPINFIALFALAKLSFWLDRPPYRMTLRPLAGQAVVQFKQRDRGWVTAEIPVDIALDGTWIIDLRGEEVAIPGFYIEFFDNAPSPGNFRMRIGSTRLEIMEEFYVVNGEARDWLRARDIPK